MSYFAVIREAGPGWSDGGVAAQPDVANHAAFMNNLAGEGFVQQSPHRVEIGLDGYVVGGTISRFRPDEQRRLAQGFGLK